MKRYIQATLLASLITASTAAGQSYPLSENTWSNPQFVDRFMGTFGVDTQKSPSVSTEEGAIFRQVAEVGSNPSAAISLLQRSITPDSSGALDFALANFQLQTGNHSSAIQSYNNAIRKFPNFGRAYKNLGLSYIQLSDYGNALPNLTKSLEILGGDGGLFGLIGYCHLNLERFGPALDAYRFALVYEPGSRDWRLGQLKALQNLGNYDDVEKIIYRYIEEKPSEPEFWLQQANAFIALRKYPEAAANLEIVKLLGGGDKNMLVLLGDLYVNMDSASLAIEPYSAALDTGKVEAKNALDIAKSVSRRLPAIELKAFLTKISESYGSALAADESLTLLTLQAANAMSMGQKDEGMNLLSQVVAKDPLNGGALLTLGSHYYGEAEYERALDYYSRAEKVEDVKLEALLGSARVLVKQSKYTEAIYRLKAAQVIQDQAFIAQYINTLENFVK